MLQKVLVIVIGVLVNVFVSGEQILIKIDDNLEPSGSCNETKSTLTVSFFETNFYKVFSPFINFTKLVRFAS